jgi:type II secretory pathway predicted ATPase ExeA
MADAPYLKHFGLKEEAFSPVPNPRFFFLTPTHAIAMEKTRLTVQSGKGLSVVYGEHGTGKSSLARLLHAQFLEKGFRSVMLTNPSFPTPFALLKKIVAEFEVPPAYSYGETLDRFKNYLFEYGRNPDLPIVLIIDEAQALRFPLLELLRQIMNYETNEAKLLQLVLFGEDALRGKLSHTRMASFRSRIAMASGLSPLTSDEVAQMLTFRWNVASGGQPHPFDDDAVALLGEAANGNPREVNILADNSLLLSFLSRKSSVDREPVEQAVADRRQLSPQASRKA